MKQTISEEEYNSALNTYQLVQNEKSTLENISFSNVYNLPKTFDQAKIFLLRKNKEIDLKIERLKKQFLNEKSFSKEAYEILEEAIAFIKQCLEANQKCDFKKPNVSPILIEMAELLSQKKSNTFLYEYLNNLETEEQNALKIINAYQKQNKKPSFFKR